MVISVDPESHVFFTHTIKIHRFHSVHRFCDQMDLTIQGIQGIKYASEDTASINKKLNSTYNIN